MEQNRILISLVYDKLAIFFDEHREIDESHGYLHAENVDHESKKIAVLCGYKEDSIEMLKIRITALLHDIDDSKYFNNKSLDNAEKIMKECNLSKEMIDEIKYMISIISVSKNENLLFVPDRFYQIIPRSADRYTASGYEGLLRCVMFRRTMKLCNKLSKDSDMTYKDDVNLFEDIKNKDIEYILKNVKRNNYTSVKDVIMNRVIPICYIEMFIYKNIPKVVEMFQKAADDVSVELDRFIRLKIRL